LVPLVWEKDLPFDGNGPSLDWCLLKHSAAGRFGVFDSTPELKR